MNQTLTCHILSTSADYDIEIKKHLLFSQAAYLKTVANKFAIITDDQVAPLYAEPFKQHLIANGLEADLFSFPKGESHKTRATKEHLEDQLFEKGFRKDSAIIAIGGGVVTDMAGYIAATFCRGLPLIMIPTTLLAMVDASIGGKTAVNLAYGKNMIGCIYQPIKVLIDLTTLKSLSKFELSNGMVELIKHSLIADDILFSILERGFDAFWSLDFSFLKKVIYKSCQIKKEIVEQDEKEKGKRHLLNFGHTIGHALEHLSHYSLSHGQAVAIGLVVESYLSVEMGLLDLDSLNRIKNILIGYGLSLKLPRTFPLQEMLKMMKRDKKSNQGQINFVLIEKIGSPLVHNQKYCISVEEPLIEKAIEWMNNDLCCDHRAHI